MSPARSSAFRRNLSLLWTSYLSVLEQTTYTRSNISERYTEFILRNAKRCGYDSKKVTLWSEKIDLIFIRLCLMVICQVIKAIQRISKSWKQMKEKSDSWCFWSLEHRQQVDRNSSRIHHWNASTSFCEKAEAWLFEVPFWDFIYRLI